LYLEQEEELAIEAREGEVESLTSARTRGLGMRVLCGGRLGFSFTNNLSSAEMELVADRALAAARHMSDDAFPGFVPAPANGLPELKINDTSLAAVPRSEKIKKAMMIEAAALAVDPRVKRVRGAEYQEVSSRVRIINSAGADLESLSTLVSASVEVVAEDRADAQSSYEFETVHYYDMLDVEMVGREAARRAVALLGGGSLAPGQYPVVLSPMAAAALLSVLAPAAFGDAVLKNRSWLAGRQGQAVASKLVTVVDDPLNAAGPGAQPFDDEGSVSRTTTVIAEGVLERFLYDVWYGGRAGVGSSGNGVRGSYAAPPEVSSTNWILLPGRSSESDLIGQVDDGLYVVDFMGLHTADSASGEFSLGAQGFRIVKGKLGDPVARVALAGELEEVLAGVEAVSDTVKFSGDSGSPAVLIGRLDLSG
jgi:PmbA protein